MFLIFGDKHRTTPVPDGLTLERACPKCGLQTVFRERVVSQQFRLYFVEMFTHGSHRVLECSACKTAFVTDEIKDKPTDNDHSGTLYGTLQNAVTQGRKAVEDGAVSRTLEQVEAQTTAAMGVAQEALGGLLGRLRGDDDEKKR